MVLPRNPPRQPRPRLGKEPGLASVIFLLKKHALGNLPVDNRPPHCPAGREEEQVDVRVDLADDGEIDVKVDVESLEGDICAQTPVLPFIAERIRHQCSILFLAHEDDWVQNARDSGGREHCRPDDTVRARDVVV
jgi:hypothetical protein